jgi:dTDP-4-amino-4,6-dideoxygalactose transaminase
LALCAIGVGAGDEVLCPSLSFIASANAIKYTGASPVFVDVEESTYNIDPTCIESAITPRTKAILIVHQVGMPASLAEINDIAARHGLSVIEDAACAVGSEYKGRRIGLPHTSIACFSFHPRKVLTTAEGGMITTSDEEVAVRLRRLRQHAMGISDLARHSATRVITETYDEVGYNYRMTDLQAAIGLVQLARLDTMLSRRRELAARYNERLVTVPWLVTPFTPTDSRSNYQSYMVRLAEDAPVSRDQLMQELLDCGVSTRRGIMAIHRETPYRDLMFESRMPVTNRLADSGLILPLYDQMSQDEQDFVVDSIFRVSGRF